MADITDKRQGAILGLVPDVDSVGWSLVDFTSGEVLGMGVHRFAPPLEPKTGASLARKRRQFYYARINRRRTTYRKRAVLRVLRDHGLVPADAAAAWLQSAKGERPIIDLRVAALDSALTARELAQVLYYLSIHRGYDPRGCAIEGDPDSQKMLSSIAGIAEELKEGPCRTAGELLYHHGRMRNRGGGHECTCSREIIEAEARAILSAQAAHGGPVTPELEKDYLDNLLFTRSTAATDAAIYGRVGFCTYFPTERRAAAACPTNERLCALERLKHVRLVYPDGHEAALCHKDVMECMDILFSTEPIKGNKACRVRYTDLLKRVGAPEGTRVKGVLDKDLGTDVYVPRAYALMRRAGMPAHLLARLIGDPALGDGVAEALTYASSEEVLLDRLALLDVDLDDAEIASICAMPYATKALSGYCNRSLKAERLLLDMMESDEVATLWDAEEACGLSRVRMDKGQRGHLLPSYASYEPTCTNPVVLRATSRMRRVVNSVIRKWGMPDEIRICLGRDLKRSKKERMSVQKNQSRRRKSNEELAARAAEIIGIDPAQVSASLLRALSLWGSQGGMDVLSGEEISFERVCLERGYAHVTHILPAHMTGESGMANSLLALDSTVRSKGTRSPYEWCEEVDGAPTWDELCRRVSESELPYSKKSRILERDVEGRSVRLLDRTVNDRRYMSRAFMSYLADTLGDDEGNAVRVSSIADAAVFELGRVWGLTRSALPEGRDGVEPALRASIVAACDAPTVLRCARYGESRLFAEPEERDALLAESMPYPRFCSQVQAMCGFVVPTRMHDHGVTGEALEQTNRSVRRVDESTGYAVMKGSDRTVGNYKVLADGTARIVGGMAMVRLWLDPAVPAKRSRKGSGAYYPEPVYINDMPVLSAGGHVPRYADGKHAPCMWPEVPSSAREADPVIVHLGDIIEARGKIGRYAGIDTAGPSWTVVDPTTGAKMKDFPTIKSLCADDRLRVVEEDCLGLVWLDRWGAQANVD